MLNWLWKKQRPANSVTGHPAEPGLPVVSSPASLEPEGFATAWAALDPDLPASESPSNTDHGPTATETLLVEQVQLLVRDHFLDHLPQPSAFPAVAMEVVSLLDHKDPELHEMLRVLERDPAITMELLRAANSAYYHRGTDAADLRSAALRLGTRASGELAVGVASLALFDISQRAEYELFQAHLMTLHRRAMATAFGASEFAFRKQIGHPQQAFLGGMFHDIGHVLALKSMAALMVGGRVPQNLPFPLVEAVTEALHVEFGYTALTIWSLPAYLPALCSRHHDPQISTAPETEDLHLVRAASGLLRLLETPEAPYRSAETRQSLEALGLDRARAADLYTLMDRKWAQVLALFPA